MCAARDCDISSTGAFLKGSRRVFCNLVLPVVSIVVPFWGYLLKSLRYHWFGASTTQVLLASLKIHAQGPKP